MTTNVTRPMWPLNAAAPELYFAQLSHLGLIEIEGEQAESFMNGQITADVTGLQANQWKWGAHCDPKGKMLASFRIFKHLDGLKMLLPVPAIDVDLPQLQKYAVFSKAELKNATSDYVLIGIAGTKASQWVAQHYGETTELFTQIDHGFLLKDGSAPARYILGLTQDAAQQLITSQAIELVDCHAWQAEEIKAGYPNISAQHAAQFVPQMCNLQSIDGISFNKGCYMGQETVARMKYRGGNKRALYILSGTCKTLLNAESKLEVAVEDSFRRAGNIIEWVQTDEQVLLTAVLANDTENDAVLRVADDESSSLTVIPLPYEIESEE